MSAIYIPHPDRFVVRSRNETIALEDEGRAEVGMTPEEADRLGKTETEVALAMMEGLVQHFPEKAI